MSASSARPYVCRACRGRLVSRITQHEDISQARPTPYAIQLRSLSVMATRPLRSPYSRPGLAIYPSNARRLSQASRQNAPGSPSTHSTLDPNELSHFSALASSWWDPHGPSRLLHLMNPLRHQFITRCRSSSAEEDNFGGEARLKEGTTYLDIGCGGGIFAESAARLRDTASVTAIDPTKEVLAIAEQHRRQDPYLFQPSVDPSTQPRLRYLNTAIEDLDASLESPANAAAAPSKNGQVTSQYCVVTAFEVIEHVSSPSAFLSHIAPHVKPGGWLIFSTIARTPMSYLITKTFAEDLLRIVPRGTHDWAKYLNVDEIRGWFARRNQMDQNQTRTEAGDQWDVEGSKVQGVVYVPGLGWKEIDGSERIGNYFFGIQRIS